MFDQMPARTGLDRVETLMAELSGEGTGADIARSHLRTGGRRVRAQLALRAADLCDLPIHAGVTLAAGCELLHNASLVHDDLQDGDRTRRDAASVWARHGTGAAICVGDLFISAAYAAFAQSGPRAGAVIRDAHDAVAWTIAGQCEDNHAGSNCDIAVYRRIAIAKSGPLLNLPVTGALWLAGRPPPPALAAAGDAIALAYQIVDDLDDRETDRTADAPNVCLSFEVMGHSMRDARALAIAEASDALCAARTQTGVTALCAGRAFLPLADSLDRRLEEFAHAA